MRKTKHVIYPSHIVVGLLPLFHVRRLQASVVVREEERHALENKMLAILSLSFESVVNVCKADIHVDHCVVGIQCVCSKEVV
jgi:hypothetical protein